MKTAVIYARYSCDNQSEQSIEGQIRVCQDYAQRNNIVILNTYIDRTMTGTNDLRPDFKKMIQDSSRKEWDYVLVYKLDRFSRNKFESTIHKKTLKDNGVKVLSAMENIPDTPEGIILESLLEGMNQYFSAELSQKVKRGMHETRLKGFWQGGTLRYGYKLDGRKIVIDEEQAEVVRYIFNEYAKGVVLREIIITLTEHGVLHKGKPFAMNTVYSMLRNEKYLGIYQNGEEVIDYLYPQIVPNEVFEKVRKIINSNKNGKKSLAVNYLLRNKMKCGYCGESLIGECGTSKNGERKFYYKCRGRKALRNGCKQQPLRKDLLENLIVDTVMEELCKPAQIDKIVKYLVKSQDSLQERNSALSILEKEQRQVENSINNVLSAIERGIITNGTSKRLKELETRQEEIERLILIERSKTVIKLSEKDIRAFYETAFELEPLMLINYAIKQIKVYNDCIEIELNTPTPKSPDDDNNQGFFFYNNLVKKPIYSANGKFAGFEKIRIRIKI